MSKNRPDAGTLDIPIQRAIFGQKVCSEFLTSRAPPARAFLEASGALTDWTHHAQALAVLDHSRTLPHGGGCAAPKRDAPACLGGGAGAHSLGWLVGWLRPTFAI